MDVHGDLDLKGNSLANVGIAESSAFPASPVPGRFCFIGKIFYVCVEVEGGLPVWVPMSRPINMLRYTATTPALEWSITHNLNCNPVMVQVFDNNGLVVVPDSINCSTMNTVLVGFNIPMTGTAIILRGEVDGMEQPIIAYEQSFTSSDTWVVTHNLGYNPIVRVIVGNSEVQPLSIVHDSTMQLTVTFSTTYSGSIRCI